MPSLNHVTTKYSINQSYDYYITITLRPNKVKRMRQVLKFEKKNRIILEKYSCAIFSVAMYHA